MSGPLVIDNWTLQDVNLAFEQGLSHETVDEILVDLKADSHDWKSVPHSVIQLEALLALLTNIVLRDSLIVDVEFSGAWDRGHDSIQALKDTCILTPLDFSACLNDITESRESILRQLCVTSSIREIQGANEALWRERHDTADPHMSALVWGGAGMLARSHVYGAPYLGHPFRQALLRQTPLLPCRRDSLAAMETIISRARAKLFQNLAPEQRAAIASFNLPPIAVEVIQESSHVSQLIPVAIQMRDRYEVLRVWLGEYQKALDSDDTRAIVGYRSTLDSVARSIEAKYGQSSQSSTVVTIGVRWLSVTVPIGTLIDMAKNRVGVRAMLNNLALAGSGDHAIRKLLDLFDEGHSRLGRDTHRALMVRSTQSHEPEQS